MLQDNSSEITYDKFIDMVNNDEVKSVTLQSDNLTIVPKKQVNPYQEISYYTNLTEDETALTKRLEGTGIIFKSEPPDAFGEFMAMMLSVLLPSVLLFVLLMFLHAPHEQRRRWYDGRWEKPRQGVCTERDRNHI